MNMLAHYSAPQEAWHCDGKLRLAAFREHLSLLSSYNYTPRHLGFYWGLIGMVY